MVLFLTDSRRRETAMRRAHLGTAVAWVAGQYMTGQGTGAQPLITRGRIIWWNGQRETGFW
jgi:hypothetical protein